jgi:hypothetical protein
MNMSRPRDPLSNPVKADSDDTVTPSLGTLVTAGWPVGVIYNDEQAMRAASVSYLVDGVPIPSSATSTPGSYTNTDPSTVWTYEPSGVGTPSPIPGVPAFGSHRAYRP